MEGMPLIGISGSMECKERKSFLLQAYFDAVSRAGGIPVLLNPYMAGEALRQCMKALDGLMLAGGGDVEPRHFGQEAIPELGETTPVRDELELSLLREAYTLQMPVFGICRGLQVMNVAGGGTLYQDLKTQHPERNGALLEHKQTEPYETATHSIAIAQDSFLSALTDAPCCMVNSMHHQAVDQPAKTYRVVATAPDGVVEAIQHRELTCWTAVQWHPERLDDALSHKLFELLIHNAAAYRRNKP